MADALMESPYVLESFFYIQDWQMEYLKSRDLFLLDSGAFSFINTGKVVDWDMFLDRYVAFIKLHNIKYYFELDIDQIIGVKETRKLRDRLEDQVGWKSIPVWHTIRGLDEWEVLCKNYDYVCTSLSGFTDTSRWFRKNKHKPLHAFLDIAQKHNAKVHGLGFTAIPKLKIHNRLYSIDSTSWLMGARKGQFNLFVNGEIKNTTVPSDKRVESLEKIDRHNFAEWRKFQKYAEKYL